MIRILHVNNLFFLYILIYICYWLCYYSCLNFPLCPLLPSIPIPSSNSLLSSCPWVMHKSSLATPLPSPIYFIPTNLFFLIFAHFPPFSSFPLPNNTPPNDLHTYDSVHVLVVCLVCYLDSIIDSCKLIAILIFIVLIFFYLYNSL